MARERWFYAQGGQRRGPVRLGLLVETLLGQPEPRTVLVWKKGFGDWTRAEDVPEVERRLAPLIAQAAAAAPKAPVAPPVEARPPRARVEEAKPGSPALVYGGIAAGVAVLGLLGWLFWPRAEPVPPGGGGPVPLGGTTTENAPAVVVPAPPKVVTPTAAPTASPVEGPVTPQATVPAPLTPAPAEVADRETNLPPADLRRLRPVWIWEDDTLRATVYNGTGWRVTELYARVSRFINEDFTEDRRPLLLLPPAGQVDAGVADLLNKVAPDRKKPGLNPLDTGVFEGKAGARPENFRAEIESARGYAPAR